MEEEKPVNPPNSPASLEQQQKVCRHHEPMEKVLSKLQVRVLHYNIRLNKADRVSIGPETPFPPPSAPDVSPSAPKEAFQWTPVAIGWYTALIWSRIYLSEAEAYQGAGGIYSSTNILLFKRSVTEQEISLRSPKGAIDAVGNAVAQRISSIGLK